MPICTGISIPVINSMSKQKSNVIHNTAFAAIGSYTEDAASLICSILIARALGPEAYGTFTYVIWLAYLAIIISNSGISLAITKAISEAIADKNLPSPNWIYRYLATIQKFKLFSSLIPLSIVMVLTVNWESTEIGVYLTLVIASAVVFKAAHMLRIATLRGLESFGSIAILSTLMAPLQIILVAILYYMQAPLAYFFLQYLIISFLSNIASYYFLKRQQPRETRPKADIEKYRPVIKEQILYLTPAIILATLACSQSEIFFLNIFSGPETIAFFQIGYMLALSAAGSVPGLVDFVLLPIMSRTVVTGDKQTIALISRAFRYKLHLNLLLIGPLFFYSSSLIELLYGDEFIVAATTLKVFAVLNFITSFSTICQAFLVSKNQQKSIFKIYLLTTIITILADLVLVYYFSLIGGLVAFAISVLVPTILRFMAASRLIRLEFEYFLYVRSFACAAISVVAMMMLKPLSYSIVNMVVGSIIYILCYITVSIVLRCHSSEDYSVIRAVLQRDGPGS